MGESRGSCRVLVGKTAERRLLGRPKLRWKDNIKIDLRKVEWSHGLDRCGSGEGVVVGCCVCGNEPSGSIKFQEFLE
jgi:hypothetical protein